MSILQVSAREAHFQVPVSKPAEPQWLSIRQDIIFLLLKGIVNTSANSMRNIGTLMRDLSSSVGIRGWTRYRWTWEAISDANNKKPSALEPISRTSLLFSSSLSFPATLFEFPVACGFIHSPRYLQCCLICRHQKRVLWSQMPFTFTSPPVMALFARRGSPGRQYLRGKNQVSWNTG